MAARTSVLLLVILCSISLMVAAHDHHDHSLHNHDHDHEHEHEHKRGDEHVHHEHDKIEENIHKRFVQSILKASGGDKLYDIMDEFMRPLPFLAQSLLSTAFISIVPIFFIYALNMLFMRSEETRAQFTYVLFAFATGGLLGDVFFHTLPHLSEGGHGHDHSHAHHDHSHEHSHDHGHDHEGHGHAHSEEDMQRNLIIIVGIVAFFLIEKLTTTCLGGGHSHDHGHTQSKPKSKDSYKKGKKNKKQVDEDTNNSDTNEKDSQDLDKERRFKSYAVISMIGDFIHNFTDGLSIGVSYVADYKMGLVTTMAMFFHEIPHEVGDFAILFQLKYSVCQIVGLQMATATGAMVGTAIGSMIGQVYLTECLAFTSGGFLYFAINGLMTELKEVKTVFGLICCLCSMSLGLYFMYVFALFE